MRTNPGTTGALFIPALTPQAARIGSAGAAPSTQAFVEASSQHLIGAASSQSLTQHWQGSTESLKLTRKDVLARLSEPNEGSELEVLGQILFDLHAVVPRNAASEDACEEIASVLALHLESPRRGEAIQGFLGMMDLLAQERRLPLIKELFFLFTGHRCPRGVSAKFHGPVAAALVKPPLADRLKKEADIPLQEVLIAIAKDAEQSLSARHWAVWMIAQEGDDLYLHGLQTKTLSQSDRQQIKLRIETLGDLACFAENSAIRFDANKRRVILEEKMAALEARLASQQSAFLEQVFSKQP